METTELKQSHTNVKKLDSLSYSKETELTEPLNNEKIIEKERIENTPFTIIKQFDMYYLTMGRHLLEEPKETKEEIIDLVENRNWNILLRVMCIIADIAEREEIK